ncbi:hypothetical protein ML435_01805 [Staphylococcus roterodami]|nr:hypothetical protein ML435_01805 [Staphylococcus roterodami]
MEKTIQEIVVSDNYIKTALNRSFVNKLISNWEEQIEDMYDLHYPRMFLDPYTGQLNYESNHIDSLAMDIIEEREKLEKRKRSMYHELLIFDKTIAKYTSLERKQIKHFQSSNNIYIPDIIDKLRVEMYETLTIERNQRNEVREIERSEHIEMKATLLRKQREKERGN